MAENTIFDPRVSSTTEATSRRLPFAPIFDTIVAEHPPQRPLTTQEPATKVFPLPDEGNGFRMPVAVEPQMGLIGEYLKPYGPLMWAVAAGFVLLVAGVIFQNIQLARQEQTLSQLAQSTSKLAASMLDARSAEERPWVTLSDLVPQPLSIAPGAFGISLQNTGKTPAVDVKIAATASVVDAPNAASLPAIGSVNHVAGTLFPGAQFRSVLDFRPSAPVFTALFRGQARLQVHVSVSYEDTQRNSHVTQSCWLWAPALRRIDPCSGFGTVN